MTKGEETDAFVESVKGGWPTERLARLCKKSRAGMARLTDWNFLVSVPLVQYVDGATVHMPGRTRQLRNDLEFIQKLRFDMDV